MCHDYGFIDCPVKLCQHYRSVIRFTRIMFLVAGVGRCLTPRQENKGSGVKLAGDKIQTRFIAQFQNSVSHLDLELMQMLLFIM